MKYLTFPLLQAIPGRTFPLQPSHKRHVVIILHLNVGAALQINLSAVRVLQLRSVIHLFFQDLNGKLENK